MKMFGYTMDVLFPECIARMLMEFEKKSYDEVRQYTKRSID